MKKKHKADYEHINPFESTVPFFVRMEHLARYRWAREMLRRKKAQRVLDIACADGYGCEQLYADGRFVLGVDKNESVIVAAEKRYKNCSFSTLDVNQCSDKLKDYTPFDAICCFETLEHLKHPQKILNLLFDCLTHEGILMLSIPDGEYEPIDSKGNILSVYHLHAFSMAKIKKILKNVGFEIDQVLYQHLSAQMHMNFNNTARDRNISKEVLTKLFPTDKKSLELLSEIIAWPDAVKGRSYSVIFLCSKH